MNLPELDAAIVGSILELKARCAALEYVLQSLSLKAGCEAGSIEKALSQLTSLIHQRLLERAESLDPALAAQIDVRAELPDLPDSIL
ncbi:MAG: hypothetical protein M3N48_10080 [Verrucomicrobiota bacterium]|nr:hypothetical protein [Verrucomicrobiota bacterium]